jgi:hypothetical protein
MAKLVSIDMLPDGTAWFDPNHVTLIHMYGVGSRMYFSGGTFIDVPFAPDQARNIVEGRKGDDDEGAPVGFVAGTSSA